VKMQLVRDLVRECREYPQKRRQAKLRAKEYRMQQEAIITSAKTILERDLSITNSESVCRAVREDGGIEVGRRRVIRVLKRELGLSFLKTKKLHPAADSAKVRVQRQQFAMELIRLIE